MEREREREREREKEGGGGRNREIACKICLYTFGTKMHNIIGMTDDVIGLYYELSCIIMTIRHFIVMIMHLCSYLNIYVDQYTILLQYLLQFS